MSDAVFQMWVLVFAMWLTAALTIVRMVRAEKDQVYDRLDASIAALAVTLALFMTLTTLDFP